MVDEHFGVNIIESMVWLCLVFGDVEADIVTIGCGRDSCRASVRRTVPGYRRPPGRRAHGVPHHLA